MEVKNGKHEREDAEDNEYVYKKREYELYEWKACKALYNEMRSEAAEMNCTVIAPSGWYTLVDEEGELVRMLVFEDQLSGLKAMMSEKTNGSMIRSSMPISLLAGILQDSVIRPIFMNLHC